MPKPNARGGRKHKKGKKRKDDDELKGKTEIAEEGQVYGKVLKRLGDRRLQVGCSDGKTRSAIIPGKMRKRVWMKEGDILLCDLEMENQQDICYISKKYFPKDINFLKKNELIEFETDAGEEEDAYKFEEAPNENKKQVDDWDPYAGLSSSEDDYDESNNKDSKNKESSEESDNFNLDDIDDL